MITASDESIRMPRNAPPLPPETIALIRHWIDSGAKEGKEAVSTPIPTVSPIASTRGGPTRRLELALSTNAIPPKGLLGSTAPGKLELILKVGPLAPVTAVAFSPDGTGPQWLAAGSYGQVTIWDLATARPARVLTNVLGAVNDARFSSDGKLLAVGGGQPICEFIKSPIGSYWPLWAGIKTPFFQLRFLQTASI